MRKLTLAAIQFTPSDDVQENIDRVADYVRDSGDLGKIKEIYGNKKIE